MGVVNTASGRNSSSIETFCYELTFKGSANASTAVYSCYLSIHSSKYVRVSFQVVGVIAVTLKLCDTWCK